MFSEPSTKIFTGPTSSRPPEPATTSPVRRPRSMASANRPLGIVQVTRTSRRCSRARRVQSVTLSASSKSCIPTTPRAAAAVVASATQRSSSAGGGGGSSATAV